ncbi:MAG TPA: MlaD family protein [Bacteroidales bacterium]|jgi:phospholipid/cholesterol/gamma-HCH transport system substrate-binding protein|nr:MlaD family protein [Bacteroidales bacterium]
MKRNIRREAKIGLTVLVAFAIFIWGLNFLKGINLFKPGNYYVVEFTQVDGLVKSSPVLLDGFQVGLVREITYKYDRPGHIEVLLDVNRKLRIQEGSEAVLVGSLMGSPNIELKLNANGQRILKPGEALIAKREAGLMDQISDSLMQQVQQLVQRTDQLLAGVEVLINDGSLSNTIHSLEQTATELQGLSAGLNRTVQNDLPGIMSHVEQLTGDIGVITEQLSSIDFKATMSKVDHTLDGLGALTVKLNSPNNSMGMLLNDDALYVNLNQTADHASKLLLDLKEHPKRYVHFSIFGKSDR